VGEKYEKLTPLSNRARYFWWKIEYFKGWNRTNKYEITEYELFYNSFNSWLFIL